MLYNFTYTNTGNSGGLCCSGTNGFINFLTSVLRHEARDTILTMLSIPNVRHISWCFRSQFIFAGRDPEKLNRRRNARELNCLPLWSNVNLQLHGRTPSSQHYGRTSNESFSKSSKFSAHLFWAWRHPRSSPFSVWGLLWQWWLSYSFCTNVNCTNWLHTWTLNPNSSKPN